MLGRERVSQAMSPDPFIRAALALIAIGATAIGWISLFVLMP